MSSKRRNPVSAFTDTSHTIFNRFIRLLFEGIIKKKNYNNISIVYVFIMFDKFVCQILSDEELYRFSSLYHPIIEIFFAYALQSG